MNNDWQGEGLANNALLVIFSYLILLRRGEVGLTHKILILAYVGSNPTVVAKYIIKVIVILLKLTRGNKDACWCVKSSKRGWWRTIY